MGPSSPRRFLVALLTGLALAAGITAWTVWDGGGGTSALASRDDPSLAPVATTAPPAASSPTAVAPTAPSTTLQRPIVAPADPYFAEPLQQIGTIEIPKIGLVHAVYEGISLRTIDRGPGHWPGSALPGQPGNAVFAGHRVTHSHPFRRIHELVPGDPVVFTIGGTRSVYVVTEHLVVAPKDVWIIDPTPTATATLFACHPPGSARQRYVVKLALAPSG